MDGWMDGWIKDWMDGWMDGLGDGWICTAEQKVVFTRPSRQDDMVSMYGMEVLRSSCGNPFQAWVAGLGRFILAHSPMSSHDATMPVSQLEEVCHFECADDRGGRGNRNTAARQH
eukprot:363053-Chlamydomonas_euryale.AAC.9